MSWKPPNHQIQQYNYKNYIYNALVTPFKTKANYASHYGHIIIQS